MKSYIKDENCYRFQVDKAGLLNIYLIIYCVYTSIPAFPYYLQPIFRFCIILTLLLPVTVFFMEQSISIHSIIQIGSFFLLPTLMYFGYWWQKNSYVSYMASTLQFFLPLSVISFIKELTIKEKRSTLIAILLCYIVTAITTIIGNIEFPQASRWMATLEGAKREYRQHNIGGYDFVYSLVFLSPMLTHVIRTMQISRLKKLALILCLVLFFECLLTAGYTTAVLLFVLSNLFVLLVSSKHNGALIFISIITVLMFVFRVEIGNWMTNYLTSVFMNIDSEIGTRISELGNFLTSGGLEGDLGSRLLQYRKSLECFFEDPFLGAIISRGEIGGHSEAFDLLGETGLVGAALYSYIIIKARNDMRNSENISIHNVGLILFIFLLFMMIFHTVQSIPALLSIVFLYPLLFNNESNAMKETEQEKIVIKRCKYYK